MTRRVKMPKRDWAYLNESNVGKGKNGKVIGGWKIVDGEYVIAEEFQWESGRIERFTFDDADGDDD